MTARASRRLIARHAHLEWKIRQDGISHQHGRNPVGLQEIFDAHRFQFGRGAGDGLQVEIGGRIYQLGLLGQRVVRDDLFSPFLIAGRHLYFEHALRHAGGRVIQQDCMYSSSSSSSRMPSASSFASASIERNTVISFPSLFTL